MMTKTEIDEIRARCEAATPGPWAFFHNDYVNIYHIQGDEKVDGEERSITYGLADVPWRNNAEFIAHAREDIPALLDTLEKSESKCDRAYTDGYNTGKVHATNEYWPSRDYWKAHAEELKKDLERSESSHSLKNALIDDLEAERYHYKARYDALEKAIKPLVNNSQVRFVAASSIKVLMSLIEREPAEAESEIKDGEIK